MSTTQIWNNILAYILQIALLVGIGAALPKVLRLSGGGKSPAARLFYWQTLLVACLALPWLRPWHSEVIAVTSDRVTSAPLAPLPAVHPVTHLAMPPTAVIGLWLLASGVAIRLIWLTIGLLKLVSYRRRGRALPLPPMHRGMVNRATLLLSDDVTGPVTFGFFQPVVLLPASFPTMAEPMRDAILFHELLHVERYDWLFTLAEELIRAAFWFHPAIWWVLGEIQLAREQTVDRAVVEITQARDPYVDTLLAMAGINPEIDLAPAPLFLRRRHLKQRVMGIIQETSMSKTRLVLTQIAALAALSAACWIVAGAIPLEAQAQIVADGPGVHINLNGSQLMHRPAMSYPADALAKSIEGAVVVQVRLDANGEVIDDAILSGPDELRRDVQQSVLAWHFDKSAGSSVRVVNIDFVKPANALVPTPIQRAVGAPAQIVATIGTSQPEQARPVLPLAPPPPAATTIERIDFVGLSDSATAQLSALLPVHAGDPATPENLARTTDAVRAFDKHLDVGLVVNRSGGSAVRIAAPDSRQLAMNLPGPNAPNLPVPTGAQKIGANVMSANLLNAVKPVYPPLAKMARSQGTVSLEAVIGKDGMIENLALISGPPLLAQAAVDAVKQWTYKPVLLNGVPVEVVTTVNVNFSLGDVPPPAQ